MTALIKKCTLSYYSLGLPDLYDTDGGGAGVGSWSLMANSWGFTGNQYYPPPMDIWGKMMLGWVTPTVISPSDTLISLAPQCQSSSVYKITTNFPSGEYLLIENRQKVCLYDSQMGGSFSGGLAIFHIDENQPSYSSEGYPGQSGWPGNGNHYRVAILQADKLYELEKGVNRGNYGDLYHDGDTFSPSTLSSGPYPNSDSYAYGKIVKKTGISISSISTSGNNIFFRFTVNLSTVKPTSKPTTKPSISFKTSGSPSLYHHSSQPSISPRPSTNSLTSLQIKLRTDGYGSETWFYVLDTDDNNANVFYSYSYLDNYADYTFSTEVNKNHCYQVYMKDDAGDGMCCAYGQGYYEIWWGGT